MKMNNKSKIITVILSILIVVLYILNEKYAAEQFAKEFTGAKVKKVEMRLLWKQNFVVFREG